MPEDLERDTCNFLILTLESLTGARDEIKVIPIAQGSVTVFRIELDSEWQEQLLANNSEILQAIEILISTRGMRRHREFRIGFADRPVGTTGNSSGTP
jgi:hypothetical protein